MKVRFGSLIPLLLGLLLLVASAACSESTDTQPATATAEPPGDETAESLSASDRMALDAFSEQRQTLDQGWSAFHRDFDQWRAGLTSCDRSSVHEALQGFAAGIADVTAQAGDLPRTNVTREIADTVIAAAEDEESAFRQLRDRWQPDNLSLFERVEQRRSDAGRAQRSAGDMASELRKQLAAAADPDERAALTEFSDALGVVTNDWKGFHGDYASLREAAVHLDAFSTILQLDDLIAQFRRVVEAVTELPSQGALEISHETLRAAANAELEALVALHARLQENLTPIEAQSPLVSPHPTGGTTSPLDEMEPIFEESEATLEQVRRTIRLLIEDDPEEKLAELEEFDAWYERLLARWDAFHRDYLDWRETDGGCDRTEVLQALDGFILRMGEIGREVRGLPQSSYLLPMYNLLVEAAEREEGAIRALRNSWRPFTVDAFKVVDQERVTADRLRRQAAVGLQELRDRS